MSPPASTERPAEPEATAVWRLEALAFLAAGTTLFVQVLVYRVVSAKLLNNYAFLVIGLTMLGFAFSGVVLSRTLEPALRRRGDVVLGAAVAFVLTLLVATVSFCRANTVWEIQLTGAHFLLHTLKQLPIALPFAVPFTFTGFVLGLLLSSPDARARRIYCFDLVGSALGAMGVIGAISHFGVAESMLAAGTCLVLGTLLLFPPRGRFGWSAALVGILVLAAGIAGRDSILWMRYPKGTVLAKAQIPGSGVVLEHVSWDPIARIEVTRIPPPQPGTLYPSLLGSNAGFHTRFRRMLTQNNYAFTYAVAYDGRRESLQGIEETIYAAAYQATSVPHPRALVVGVGGGFDILTALYFGASHVVGVEVNAATVHILRDTYRDYFRSWIEDPRVELVLAEGRHYLASHDDRYDVLQLSGVDSYSGTIGSAKVFSESYLYTSEAFDTYLSRLTDQGILNVMRLEFSPPREMLRALVTAVGALRRAGVSEPQRNVVMLGDVTGNFVALLVKKTPFNDEELSRLARWTAGNRYVEIVASPRTDAKRANLYELFLSLGPRLQRAFPSHYPYDVSPATDDRPFFFKYSRWRHLLSAPPGRDNVPVLEYTLLMLGAVVGGVAVLCIALPLLIFHARGLRTRHAARHAFYFGGLGVGFMALEMAFLQKYGLFLGHPNYAFSVVLAALLLFSGVGSLFSSRIVSALGGVRFVAYVLSAVLLGEYFLVLPRLAGWVAWPRLSRIGLVFLMLAPVGVTLGTFFPWALDRLKSVAPQFAPWAWGINGIFSVLGPLVAVGISATWGTDALLLTAVPVYVAAAAVFPPYVAGE